MSDGSGRAQESARLRAKGLEAGYNLDHLDALAAFRAAIDADPLDPTPHRLIAASVGIAIPRDRNLFGYLSEHHSYGETEKEAGDYAEDLAAGMLATTLGLEFDADKSWDANREIYRLHDHIVSARNITQSAVGHKDHLWTTVVAAAIFVEFDACLQISGQAVTDNPKTE